MRSHPISVPTLENLVALFYDQPGDLGQFDDVDVEQLPAVYRRLLAHDEHMTVTVESHHHCSVDVRVLREARDGSDYRREILLHRQSDGATVQHGIVRLDLGQLPSAVADRILQRQTPLGRILIEQRVMRQVEYKQLYRVACGPSLAAAFSCPAQTVTFGRTALIHCNGRPAIELLEIVRPEPEPDADRLVEPSPVH